MTHKELLNDIQVREYRYSSTVIRYMIVREYNYEKYYYKGVYNHHKPYNFSIYTKEFVDSLVYKNKKTAIKNFLMNNIKEINPGYNDIKKSKFFVYKILYTSDYMWSATYNNRRMVNLEISQVINVESELAKRKLEIL